MKPSYRWQAPCDPQRRALLAIALAAGTPLIWAQGPAVAPPPELATDLPGARLREQLLGITR